MKLRLRAILLIGLFPATLLSQLPAYNVPDDPAFIFLGTSPKQVANPGTIPKFGAAIANGINLDGRVQNGLAISTPPAELLRWSPRLGSYRSGTPAFWFYNTQLSFGSVRSSGDTSSTDFALGGRVIFVGPDPYADRDYIQGSSTMQDKCLAEARQVDSVTRVIQLRTGVRPFETPDPNKPEENLKPDFVGKPDTLETVEIRYLDATGKIVKQERAVIRRLRGAKTLAQDTVRMWTPTENTPNDSIRTACESKGKASLLKKWNRLHWNDQSLSFAAASGTRFVNSAFSQRKAIGYSAWMVGTLPIRWNATKDKKTRRVNFGQVAAQLQYDRRRQILPADTVGGKWTAGLRLAGGTPTANTFAEATRTIKVNSNGNEKTKTDWSTGIEYMIAEGLWISTGVGERYSKIAKTDKAILFLHLKWGVARKPFMAAK